MALMGVQSPRLSSDAGGDAARGDEAVAFCRWAGMTLFPWQEDLLRDMCRLDDSDRWSAREVVVSLARQNGKGEVLVARELAGIYLFGEKTILHTAHFMDTAVDAQKRLWEIIEGNDDLLYWWEDDPDTPGIPHMGKTNGKENISFPNGAMVAFRTRTVKTGRGLSVELLIIDECFDLPNEIYAALSALIRAKRSAQTVFISSPVNRDAHHHGAIFSAKRWAGIDGAPRMLFREWSPGDGDDPFAESTWAKSNPSLVDGDAFGAQLIDIQAAVAAAKTSEVMLKTFEIETLGKGRWYPRDGESLDNFVPIIPLDSWYACGIGGAVDVGECALAVEVAPDGSDVAFVTAGQTLRGVHLQAHGKGGRFVVADAVEQISRFVHEFDPACVVVDKNSPAAVLVPKLMEVGIEPVQITGGTVSMAFRQWHQQVTDGGVTHDGSAGWDSALGAAQLRGEAKYPAIDRFSGSVSMLVASTFALWGLTTYLAETGAVVKPVAKQSYNPAGALPRAVKTKNDSKLGGVTGGSAWGAIY